MSWMNWFRGAVANKMAEILLDSASKMYQYLRPAVVHELFGAACFRSHDNHKILSVSSYLRMARAHAESTRVFN